MKKILYHGSEMVVDKPEFGKGARTNDYGRGFYCTEDFELAGEWACSKKKSGYVNRYELDMLGLQVMDLSGNEYNILNWLALLADNRTYWQNGSISEEAKKYLKEYFLPDISGADIITGYRADDSYFAFAQDFTAGAISLKTLSEAMRLGNLGMQVVLKSEKAFESIHFLGSESVPDDIYYSRKIRREQEARREYRKSRSSASGINDIYMLDIMREGMRNGDTRLR